MSEHTKLPVKLVKASNGWTIQTDDGTGSVGIGLARDYCNSSIGVGEAFVRAVNAHASLVAALERIRANAADFTHGDALVQLLVSGIFSTADRALYPRALQPTGEQP